MVIVWNGGSTARAPRTSLAHDWRQLSNLTHRHGSCHGSSQ
jgi:hypothetical protein